MTLFPFIGAPPPLVQPYVASNRASCVLRKTRHIWATITSMGDRFAHPAPDSSNSTSISVSVDRDESGEHDANNAVCAGSTKRTHFHRRIVGPDSLTRRDIRRREQRATRQKPVSLRPSAHTLFLDDRGQISFAADRTIVKTVLRVNQTRSLFTESNRFHRGSASDRSMRSDQEFA